MNLRELEGRFRSTVLDTVEPYLWAQKDVFAWLGEAESEACLRADLIEEPVTISLTEGKERYVLPAGVYRILEAKTETQVLNKGASPTRLRRGEYYDTENNVLWVKFPATGKLTLLVNKTPDEPISSASDEPSIHPRHHPYLIHWAARCAYLVPDAEAQDKAKAAEQEALFTQYFGARPDANVLRKQRRGPQVVQYGG